VEEIGIQYSTLPFVKFVTTIAVWTGENFVFFC